VLTEDGHEGEAYPVTGPEAITYAEVASVLSDVLGREIEHVRVRTSVEDTREGLLNAGMPEPLAEGFFGLLRWFDSGNGAKVFDTVKDVTDKQARPFRRFAEDHAGVFR